MYTCKRCGYESEYKHCLQNHLKRKVICKVTNEDIKLLMKIYQYIFYQKNWQIIRATMLKLMAVNIVVKNLINVQINQDTKKFVKKNRKTQKQQ